MESQYKKYTAEELKDKWVIGINTLFQGDQVVTSQEEDEDPMPELFDSRESAFTEMFGDNYYMLSNKDDNEFADALEGVENAKELVSEMGTILESKDVKAMEEFLDMHPELNYNDEFVQEADQFILGRKAIYTGNGGHIEGEKLS